MRISRGRPLAWEHLSNELEIAQVARPFGRLAWCAERAYINPFNASTK